MYADGLFAGLISEVCKVGVAAVGEPVRIIVLLLEVLVRSELAEESEEYVERLNYRLIILQLVHGDVAHRADNLGVVGRMHVYLGSRERCRLEGCLHLRVPLLH